MRGPKKAKTPKKKVKIQKSAPIKLQQHRAGLKNIAPTPEETTRLAKRLGQIIDKSTYQYANYPSHQLVREDIVLALLETQNRKPFFWIRAKLPFCWNHVKDWNLDFIKYEWGHINPRNSAALANQDIIENLCLMSARCNNHIQSSLPMDEVRKLFGKSTAGERIDSVLKKRKALFKSRRWQSLITKLNSPCP